MIEVSHISRVFKTFRAVNDVSFSISTGQIVGLLGPNGAGKSTTMRMIAGFLKPTSGSIKIDGIDVSENPVETKCKIGYMPESAPLYSDMIVADYLKYVAQVHGQNPDERVPFLCKKCALEEVMHKNIGELSRGYRQRVGLAHALMNDPEILILDEPTSGLDPNQVEEVRSLIKEIGKTRTVIISTHILSEVEVLCSRVIIISGGELVADSPTELLRSRYGNLASISVCTNASEAEFRDLVKGIEGIEKVDFEKKSVAVSKSDSLNNAAAENMHNPCEIKADDFSGKTCAIISVKNGCEIRPLIANAICKGGFELYELNLNRNSLEDIFHQLTQSV